MIYLYNTKNSVGDNNRPKHSAENTINNNAIHPKRFITRIFLISFSIKLRIIKTDAA
jgi:hypothetical protein